MLAQLVYGLGLFKLFEIMYHSLYEYLLNTLKIKKMSNICDFDIILNTECNLQHFTRNCRIKNLDNSERDKADTY